MFAEDDECPCTNEGFFIKKHEKSKICGYVEVELGFSPFLVFLYSKFLAHFLRFLISN